MCVCVSLTRKISVTKWAALGNWMMKTEWKRQRKCESERKRWGESERERKQKKALRTEKKANGIKMKITSTKCVPCGKCSWKRRGEKNYNCFSLPEYSRVKLKLKKKRGKEKPAEYDSGTGWYICICIYKECYLHSKFKCQLNCCLNGCSYCTLWFFVVRCVYVYVLVYGYLNLYVHSVKNTSPATAFENDDKNKRFLLVCFERWNIVWLCIKDI